MRITVVGSGDAFNAEGRFHSCYLLEAQDCHTIMVDFGATALVALRRLGRSTSEIATVVFTHLHGDHIGGVPFLVIDAMFSERRRTPLRLVGPVGLEARVRALLDATYGSEVMDRDDAPAFEFTELLPGVRHRVEGCELETFPARHMHPPHRPLCLRFVAPNGVRAAFSGDTAMCEGLLAAAADVDVLVAECSGLVPPIGQHCTWEDWCRVLPELTAQRVILTHLGREVRRHASQLLREAPPGPGLAFADDGMVVEVLPQTTEPA